MKYGLLMGFLLSTGDDPELSDISDRKGRRASAPPLVVRPEPRREDIDADEPEDAATGFSGRVGFGTTKDSDGELRMTPDGHALGFRLWDSPKTKIQVIAHDDLAQVLAPLLAELVDQDVTIEADLELVEWEKDGRAMKPFPRAHLSRIVTDEFTLPAAMGDGSVVPIA
jgi:hypothetical protein